MFDQLKTDKRIINMDVASVVREYRRFHEACWTMYADIDSWVVDTYMEKRKAADQMMVDIANSYALVTTFHGKVSVAFDQLKRAKLSQTSKETQSKLRLSGHLVGGGVPEKFAVYVAKLVEPIIGEPRSFFANSKGSSINPEHEMTGAADQFQKPMGLFSVSENTKYWHGQLAVLLEENKGYMDDTLKSAVDYFATHEKAKAVACKIQGERTKIQYNDPERCDNVFEEQADMDGIHVCGPVNTFIIKVQSSPTAGTACFLQCVHGFIVVAVVEIANIIEHQKSIETVHEYLDQVDDGYMNSQVLTVGLTPGSSVWVPAGYVPAVVGVKTYKGLPKTNEEKVFSFVQYPCLDTKPIACMPQQVRAEIKAWTSKALSRNLNMWTNGNKEALQSWSDALGSAPAAVVSVTVDDEKEMSQKAETPKAGKKAEVAEAT